MWKATLTLDHGNPKGTITATAPKKREAIAHVLDMFDSSASWDRAGLDVGFPFNQHWLQIDDHEARELIECEKAMPDAGDLAQGQD